MQAKILKEQDGIPLIPKSDNDLHHELQKL